MTDRKASDVLAALETAWSYLRKRFPDLPHVVIILASGEEGRELVKHGHFAQLRWRSGGQQRGEVLMAGETLDREAWQVYGTLVHEAAHAMAANRQRKDTSRDGRYHNLVFKTTAEELGLVVEKSQNGWNVTQASEEMQKRDAGVIAEIGRAAADFKRVSTRELLKAFGAKPKKGKGEGESGGESSGGEDESPKGRNLSVAQCACPRKIRVASRTLMQGPILCLVCNREFEIAD